MTERRKPDDRRREIADAALEIIAERGLASLTAAEIAREVGVTDAALFHHFRSKDDILLAVLDRVEALLFVHDATLDVADPIDRLGEFFRQRVSTIHRNPGAGRLVLSDVLIQIAPPSGVAKVRAFRRRSVGSIRSCLRAARREGLLADAFDVPDATVLVLGALMALTQAPHLVSGNGSVVALAAKVWRDLEHVLRKPSSGASREAPSARRQSRAIAILHRDRADHPKAWARPKLRKKP